MAAVGARVKEGGGGSVCGVGESFSHFKRGSTVDGTRNGLAHGVLVEKPVALLLPPRLVIAGPPLSLPLELPP